MYIIVNSYLFRYDFPDPGSEIDYITDNLVDYIKYYEGVSAIKFKKKTANTKPFVRKFLALV